MFSGFAGAPGKQRGILNLGGMFSKKKSKTASHETGEVDRDRQTTVASDKSTQESTTQDRTSTTELLSPEVQELLIGLVQQQATGGDGGTVSSQVGAVADELLTRARGAETAINAGNSAILERARFQGERETGRALTQLAQAAGSSQNTFVQQAGLEANNDLETSMAALAAELSTNARGIGTQEFQVALQALATGGQLGASEFGSIANIAEVLKGATAKSTEQVTAESQGQESLTSEEIIAELIKTLTIGGSTGKSSGFSLELGLDV